jgi:predicted tellurium resistance membrane protein TerC
MKILRISIFAIYLLIYGYSAYKTTIEPKVLIWGYICALVFAILSLLGIKFFIENEEKNTVKLPENERNNIKKEENL